MPIYYNPQGKTVSSHEALIDGTRLRPGYKEVMQSGEHVPFSAVLADSKPATGSVYLTDEISAAVSQARKAHTEKFAFMGDRAPRFDEARATFLAQCNAASSAMGGAAVRDATQRLSARPERQRLLLVLTDGKPNDIDVYEGRYGLEDTRHAIQEARAAGLIPFCVTIDHEAHQYLPMLFGAQGYALVHRLPVEPQYLSFAGRRHVLRADEAAVVLRLDDILAVADAIDHRLRALRARLDAVTSDSSQALFLARGIEQLAEARDRLAAYARDPR